MYKEREKERREEEEERRVEVTYIVYVRLFGKLNAEMRYPIFNLLA